MKRETKELTFERIRRDLVKWYRAEVKGILEELLPRIERGDFTDLGDGFTFVDINDPRLQVLRAPKSSEEQGSFEEFMERARQNGWDEAEIDPGICLLKWAIEQLPVYQDERVARMVACASRYAATLAGQEYDGIREWTHISGWCLAWDVRAAYRRRHPRRRHGNVLQLVRPIPAHPLSSAEPPPGAA